MITYTTYSINYTYIVLATNTTDTYTYTNYAYTTLRYMYYNTININFLAICWYPIILPGREAF